MRSFAVLAGIILFAAVIPTNTLAYGAAAPEVTDPAGDVSLAVAGQALTGDLGTLEATAALDLIKAYIDLESNDAFTVNIEVDEFPSYWRLPRGNADQSVLANDDLPTIEWTDAVHNDALKISTTFTIGEKKYRLTASLAEVRLPAGGTLSPAMADDVLLQLDEAGFSLDDARAHLEGGPGLPDEAADALDQAHAAIQEAKRIFTCACSPLLPDAEAALTDAQLAAGRAEADVETWTDDPSASALMALAAENLDEAVALLPVSESQAGDVRVALANLEALQDALEFLEGEILFTQGKAGNTLTFALDTLEAKWAGTMKRVDKMCQRWVDKPRWCAEVHNGLQLAGSKIADARTSLGLPLTPGGLLGALELNFASYAAAPAVPDLLGQALGAVQGAKAQVDDAIADLDLSVLDETMPDVLVFQRYTLYDEAAQETVPIGGSLDPDTATIQFLVLKNQVGSPAYGRSLSAFHVESWAAGERVDRAPDAAAQDGSYRFRAPAPNPGPNGQSGTGGSGGGAGTSGGGSDALPVSKIRVDLTSASERAIRAGDAAVYVLTLTNHGTTLSRGSLSLSSASPGWTHQVSPQTWNLLPGEAAEVRVTVTALRGGAPDQTSKLFVSPEGGETTVHEFHTTLGVASAKETSMGGFAWLLIGGILALAIAGGVTGVVIYRRRH